MKVVLPALILVAGILGISLILAHSSCAKPSVEFVNTGVVQTTRDPKLFVAVEQARKGLPEFIKRFQHPNSSDRDFGVQATFNSAGGPEHIWVHLTRFKNSEFIGKLQDEPNEVPGLHKGQFVTVRQEDVTDWIYESHGKQVGGFTITALESEGQSK